MRSPILASASATPAPTAITTPQGSCPAMTGSGLAGMPEPVRGRFFGRRYWCRSEPHMPEAFISSTTSPGPGVGSGKLRSSTLRSPRKTTPRMRLVLPRELGLLAGRFAQRHRGGRALALPFLLVDALAEEVELDGHVVGVLEEDLEERRCRIREAAEVHLDLVTLYAAAHL